MNLWAWRKSINHKLIKCPDMKRSDSERLSGQSVEKFDESKSIRKLEI